MTKPIFKREPGSRDIQVTNLPDGHEPMTIRISYLGDGNVGKGIALDNVIIPALLPAELTEVEELVRGCVLVELLNLKPIKPPEPGSDCHRYRTSWGSKTALGLFRTVSAVIDGFRP